MLGIEYRVDETLDDTLFAHKERETYDNYNKLNQNIAMSLGLGN